MSLRQKYKLIPLRTHLMVPDALTKSLPGPALKLHLYVMLGNMPFYLLCWAPSLRLVVVMFITF
jgi:hypothetical protein